jgi:hypothetical protein
VTYATSGAGQVREALRFHFHHPKTHVVLEEVRAGTGQGPTSERYADALVCSVWPSRGIYLMGVEIKVSRADWKAELAKPQKSAAVQRFCERWWIAAPPGIVQLDELPKTWGLMELVERKPTSTKKCPHALKVVKQAPSLSPEPMNLPFIASILRNQAKVQDQIRLATRDSMWRECSADRMAALESELLLAKIRCEEYEKKYTDGAALRAELNEWKQIMAGRTWGADIEDARRRFAMISAIERLPTWNLANELEGVAALLRALDVKLVGSKTPELDVSTEEEG